jgi:hypothetical protein
MSGMLRVRAAHTPDGDRQVMTILPNGARFLLPYQEALTYAFALLITARDLAPSKAELDAAVPVAYDRTRELLIDRRTQ